MAATTVTLLSLIFIVTIFVTETFADRGLIGCDSKDVLTFQCQNQTACINRKQVYCDGVPDCPDGSDEYIFNSSMEETHGIRCIHDRLNVSKSCHLPHKYVCDHELDCKGGIDECGCRHTFKCSNGDCAVKATFCDRKQDCLDGSDEVLYSRTSKIGFHCPVTKYQETRHCILPDHHVCDGDSDCDNGIDECFCDFTAGKTKGKYITDIYSNDKCYRCLDGSLIIPYQQVCDELIHCPDMSDEYLCSDIKSYTMPEICHSICQGNGCNCLGQAMCVPANSSLSKSEAICLPGRAICDHKIDCLDGSDERFCADSDQYFHCYDNKTKIRWTKFCNGPKDCEDGSDESHCAELNDFYCSYYRGYFTWVTDWENTTQTSKVRIPPGRTLEPNYPFYAHRCDGVPTCPLASDECLAPECEHNRPGYCQFITPGYPFICNNSGSLLVAADICEGMPSCNDTHPHISDDELYCPNRFYCDDKGAVRLPIHIPLKSRCDGIQDCADQSDEMGCSTVTHFYCNDSGSKHFIRKAEVCDGTKDCESGVDECQNCNPSPFSSDQKLISSRILIVLLWIIGIFATLGNIFAMIHQTRLLIKPMENTTMVGKTNRILVLNLSIADGLVGVYLLLLGIKDAMTTDYCLLDQEWRASKGCAALGTLALIGTEASVFILVAMTGYRLFIVWNPFKRQQNNQKFVTMAVLGAWTLSCIIAILPNADSLKDYFVPCVWYRERRVSGVICKKYLRIFSERVSIISNSTGKFDSVASGDYSWDNMFDALADINPKYRPERFFGYYSAHSVCLPRIFPDREHDVSWGYSMFIIVLNFLAFLMILISYIFIYRGTQMHRPNVNDGSDQATAMQRKITRIVATDFCCWIPICIMAFISVGGASITDEAYAVTAIILLPINAAMNPFLYSDTLDMVWDKMRPLKTWFKRTPCGKKITKKKLSKKQSSERPTGASARSCHQVYVKGKFHGDRYPSTGIILSSQSANSPTKFNSSPQKSADDLDIAEVEKETSL